MGIKLILGIFLVTAFIIVAALGIVLATQSGQQTVLYGQKAEVKEPVMSEADLSRALLPVLYILGFTGVLTVIQKTKH